MTVATHVRAHGAGHASWGSGTRCPNEPPVGNSLSLPGSVGSFPISSLHSSPLLDSQGTIAQGAGCFGWPPKSRTSSGGSQGRMPGLPRTEFPVSNWCLSPKHMQLSLLVLGWPFPGVILDEAPTPPAPLLQICKSWEQRSCIAHLHACIHPSGTDRPGCPCPRLSV